MKPSLSSIQRGQEIARRHVLTPQELMRARYIIYACQRITGHVRGTDNERFRLMVSVGDVENAHVETVVLGLNSVEVDHMAAYFDGLRSDSLEVVQTAPDCFSTELKRILHRKTCETLASLR
uniref:Uncharacterized protein n=1 Tax=viral metagenome TaxID=1070528 RepID=A0A2V0R9K8_9ZZZZ